jgi:UDP-glucose 4-epimerase
MKTILITGGAGFIGSHTADALLKLGMRVTVFDDLSTGKLTNLDLFNSALQFIPGDVLDYPALLTQIKRCDAVLHLAAISSVPQSIEDPLRSQRVNMQGFLHVLQGVREAQKPIRLVYASSASVYGSAIELPCNDEVSHLPAPLSPYALEKITNEKYAQLYTDLFGIKSLALRYFNVYGPRQDPRSMYSGVITKFISAYTAREEITVFGDGNQSRDFIYIQDVVKANVLALASDYSGVLNIATGTAKTLQELLHCIEETGRRSAQINFMDARSGDIRESYASISKAEKNLGFCAGIDLAAGIQLLLSK